MRDGVVLRADVYRPAAPGSYPALLQRTPYSKNDQGRRRGGSAPSRRRGYVVVVQDTRGRYTSDGVAVPHDEADDGYDSVQWASTLPEVNGKVGMFGGSYLATTQLEAATRQPPALVALYPASSYNRRHDMVFQGGAFYLSDGLVVESRTGDRCAPARADAVRRSGRPDRARCRLRVRCSARSGSGSCRSSRSTSWSSIASLPVTGRCCRTPTPTASGRLATSSRTTTSFWYPRFISPGGTTRC